MHGKLSVLLSRGKPAGLQVWWPHRALIATWAAGREAGFRYEISQIVKS